MTKKLKSYAVTWDSNTEAFSPLEAARDCWRAIRYPDSTANVFTVTDELGNIIRIDLEEQGWGDPEIDRGRMYDLLWGYMEPPIEGCHSMIQRLMEAMPDTALSQLVEGFMEAEDD